MTWSFAERLKIALEQKGWSQKVLAERSGIQPAQIGRILRGERNRVGPDTVRKLAIALEVSADYLLGLDDEEKDFMGAAAQLVSARGRRLPGVSGSRGPLASKKSLIIIAHLAIRHQSVPCLTTKW
jgi:transcriptional regulator with XRE-family HTH domain